MPPPLDLSVRERAELEELLNSGILNRAPNLASFLSYVCERYFEGQADAIKEYSIAVEALHRPPDFDQKKDSIVRVEAHRLRKRLADFYNGPGRDHEVRIEIPNGQYAPRFTYRIEFAEPTPPITAAPTPSVVSEPLPPPAKTRRWNGLGILVVLGVIALLALILFVRKMSFSTSAAAGESWQGSSSEPVPTEFRWIAGYKGPPFTDRQGRRWQPDSYFKGGASISFEGHGEVEGLPDPNFITSRREGNFQYAIPVRPGTYELHLHFIGAKSGDLTDPASLPLFRVLVNNKPVLETFDPISEAGGFLRFHSRVIRDVTPGSDGIINLAFRPLTNTAFVSALEILSSEPGRVRPVRIVAAKSSVIDSQGVIWAADEDATGGVIVERRDSIQDPNLKMLFAGEHYGNFAYHIPVPPGRYRLRLYFAETYFGSKLPAATPASGARLFNVFSNGVALLRDFDITKEAGGANRAVIRSFENVEPNAQGNILLQFVPTRNYAEVNAIEVSQMD